MLTTALVLIVLSCGLSACVPPPPGLSVRTVVSGLQHPWDVGVLPDGSLLFTERGGRIGLKRPNVAVRFLTVNMSDLFASGETGLMGLAIDPNFASNRRFYTCQGHQSPLDIRVIVWQLNQAGTGATRVVDPLVDGLPVSTGRHGGCQLEMSAAGHLVVGTGDAAIGTNAQNLASLGGKTLRVNRVTGAPAPGNPFASSSNPDTRLILTFGHRNVQGVALRPGTSQVWTAEHGPDRDDEINLLVSGRNYGWNPVPGYNETVPMTDTVEFPSAIRARWSSGAPTVATSGIDWLRGPAWGSWQGGLAVATLKGSALRFQKYDAAGKFVGEVIPPELNGDFGRLRVVESIPGGTAIYVTTSNGSNDRILRVEPG